MDLKRKHVIAPVSAVWRGVFVGITLVLLAGIGAVRIISTYHVFNQTTDEAAHVVTGMEWLERGTYTLEPLHPPLARIAVALCPYLSGLRLTGQGDLWEQGNEILFAHDRYLHNLSLARLGALPFFLLATLLVWYWGRVRYGNGPALVATLLFTTSPVVLAHAGLATTDMAVTATFTGALLAYIKLLERPTYLRSAILGLAAGLATLSKFSALLFMAACGIALLVWRWLLIRGQREKAMATHQFRWARGLTLAALTMFLVVWAGYRFSTNSVTDAAARPHPTLDHLFGSRGTLHDWAYSSAESRWVPAPAFFRGLAAVRQKEAGGHKSYLLGHIRQTGWWYFFPFALAVKTTLPFLVLIAMGTFFLGRSAWLERNWITATPMVAALALLLVCMPSQINIGVRHILPIYPLFAIIGGVGACRFWSVGRAKYVGIGLILTLFTWHLVSSVRAHPDYLAYFNEFAGRHPERILIDSDLDWGQDLLRLSAVLQEKHIEEVSIAYAGSPELDLHSFNLPPFRVLAPHQPSFGWIAISLLRLKTGGFGSPNDSFSWLEAYKPVCLVGRSIRLYYVPVPTQGETERQVSKPPSGNDR
jgi:hypothetical protein